MTSPRRSTMLVLLAIALTVAGCRDARGAPQRETAVIEPIPVRVVPVQHRSGSAPITAIGTIASREEVTLAFKLSGPIATIHVREGDQVRAGQVLARLDLREIDAQVAKAGSALAKAERDHRRAQRLHADSVATRAQLDDAETAVDVARADLRVAAVNRRFAVIMAAAPGIVLRRFAEPGQVVAAGSPILAVANAASGTVLRAGLADRDVLRVRPGDRAVVRLDAMPGRVVQGTVRQIAGGAGIGGTYLVEVLLDGATGLASGMVGRLEIVPSRGDQEVLVPVEAIVEADGDRASVFTVDGTGRARRLRVQLAGLRGADVAISSGLDGVTTVVTDGAAYLDDGLPVRRAP